MRLITHSGDGAVLASILVAVNLAAPCPTSRVLGLASLVALLASTIVKRLCRRERPSAGSLLPAPDRFSLPSGHSACAFAIAVSGLVVCPAAAPLLVAWAVAIGLSRVVLGVHYPLDVAVGAFLGSAAAAGVLAVLA